MAWGYMFSNMVMLATALPFDFLAVSQHWWFCSAIVFWRGQPCIGGSSHQSLPGIVDSCEFYISESLDAAAPILQKRKITHVIAYEPDRVISNSAQILDRAPPAEPLIINLYKHPAKNRPLLRFIHGNTFSGFLK